MGKDASRTNNTADKSPKIWACNVFVENMENKRVLKQNKKLCGPCR